MRLSTGSASGRLTTPETTEDWNARRRRAASRPEAYYGPAETVSETRGVAAMPSLKQRLRELELRREEERRRQLSSFDAHHFLELAAAGKTEAEIAGELGVSPDIARQALSQMAPPPKAGRRRRS